jgi:hypothetical protein
MTAKEADHDNQGASGVTTKDGFGDDNQGRGRGIFSPFWGGVGKAVEKTVEKARERLILPGLLGTVRRLQWLPEFSADRKKKLRYTGNRITPHGSPAF